MSTRTGNHSAGRPRAGRALGGRRGQGRRGGLGEVLTVTDQWHRARVGARVGDSGTSAEKAIGGETQGRVASTNVEGNLEDTQEEGKRQGAARVAVRGEAGADTESVAVSETNHIVGLGAGDTLRQTKHRQLRRVGRKVDGLGIGDAPRADEKQKLRIVHDVDTSGTANTGGLQPLQTLKTDGTVVGDGAERLGNGHRGGGAGALTKVDFTRVQPQCGRPKGDGRKQRVSADTKPHVTGVGESGDGVQVVATHDTGSQGVEGEISAVSDQTQRDGDGRCQPICGGDVETTLVVQISRKDGGCVVYDGVVYAWVDCERPNQQANGRNAHRILCDGQCPYRSEVVGGCKPRT